MPFFLWRLLHLALLIAMISTVTPAYSEDPVPDKEKRSSIHEVDGYAYLSEDKTIGQIRIQAFAQPVPQGKLFQSRRHISHPQFPRPV